MASTEPDEDEDVVVRPEDLDDPDSTKPYGPAPESSE